jgi:hypothetical protein
MIGILYFALISSIAALVAVLQATHYRFYFLLANKFYSI